MGDISTTEQPNMKEVDLNTFDLQQLTLFKQQIDQALNMFQESLHNLKIAQNKFQESNNCLDKFTPDVEGNLVLIPLTGSMYVPGRLLNTQKVLINIGTGYFAEKNVLEAKEYFVRRVQHVTEQIEKIQILAQEKHKIRELTIQVMENKLQNLQKQVAEKGNEIQE